MSISSRDRRALMILGGAALVAIVAAFWPQGDAGGQAAASLQSVAAAEARLASVRRLAAQAPAMEQELERVKAELGRWERRLIESETAQQAQAEALQILRRVAGNQQPPIEFQSVNLGPIRRLGKSENYGEVLFDVSFTCTIEQLLNLLADLTAQQQAVVTEDINISSYRHQEKLLRVQLRVAGLVRRDLVPEAKGLGAF